MRLTFDLRLGLASMLIILFAAACRQNTGASLERLPTAPYAGALQAALDQVVRDNQVGDRLGISAAVIAPGYAPWTGVSGNSMPGAPLTVDMRFDAGSVAKNFEAALVLVLAEENLLDLDDPISTYLPAYPHVDGSATIRQLLDHTSGVFNVFEHPDFPWVGAGVDYSRDWPVEQVFERFVGEPYGQPGDVQHYSSTNYLLVTEIVEQVTGDSAAVEIERRLLAPLQLEHSLVSMGAPPPEGLPVAHAWVDVDRDGTLDDLYGIPLTWKASLTHPVLFTTAGDLAAWMNALYHDKSVLQPASLEAMLSTPQVAEYDPEGGRYGLGVVDYSDRLGVDAIGHAGSSLGYSAAALYLPDEGISVAWLVNTGESPRDLADRIMIGTWRALYAVLRGG